MKMPSLLTKARGATRKPVSQHLDFRIVKRMHHEAPYDKAWHEYLAFLGEHLVGRMSAFEVPIGSGDCWMNDLWVEQKHRRKGLSQELLRVLIEEAQASGYERLLGELTPYDSTPMQAVERFYRAQGFEIVEQWEGTDKTVAVRFL